MTRHKNTGKVLDRFFARALKPTREQLELSREKLLLRLSSPAREERNEFPEPGEEVQRRFNFLLPAVGAVAMALIIAGSVAITRNFMPSDRPAMAQAVAGSLYRISGGKSHVVQAGQKIESGILIRSDANNGAVLALADGSRIEMRSQSELALESADDGVRIRLTTGSVIVNAARQRTGHLYVQTRDVTVSVIGTVFLVESIETGSRVAVIQGEVHVQQGSTLKKLLPGEQVTTIPSLKPLPVAEEISWSRNAAAHVALLQQAIAIASAISTQNRQPRQTFDAVSITRGREGPGLFGARECGGRAQLDSKRLVITNTTLYYLITLAYGIDCRDSQLAELISGAPAWIKTDRFTIDAAIPDGLSSYTAQELNSHNAPTLQQMLQTLLADRFKLVVRRETRETPVYNLIVVADGKLKASEDQNPNGRPVDGDMQKQVMKLGSEFLRKGMLLAGGHIGMIVEESGAAIIRADATSIRALFTCFYTQIKDRMIVDKTNLNGQFEVTLQFAASYRLEGPQAGTPFVPPPPGPTLFDALQDQLGLKLEPLRVPLEVIVVDRAEGPTEN